MRSARERPGAQTAAPHAGGVGEQPLLFSVWMLVGCTVPCALVITSMGAETKGTHFPWSMALLLTCEVFLQPECLGSKEGVFRKCMHFASHENTMGAFPPE